MPSPNKTRKLTTLAMLAASALVLSWLDSLIPVSGVLPGAKLGLANLSVLMGLYLLGPGAGGVLCLLKVKVTCEGCGTTYETETNWAGDWEVEDLPEGKSWTVDITFPGFKPVCYKG